MPGVNGTVWWRAEWRLSSRSLNFRTLPSGDGITAMRGDVVIDRHLMIPLATLALLISPCAHAQGAQPSADSTTPATIGKDAQQAVEGINSFSLDLYKREIKPRQNLFLSPASVSVAMGLAYRGAKGTTADELNRTLHFNAPPVDYLRADAQLLAAMNFAGPGRELDAADAVWVQSGMPLEPDFDADVARYAKAGVRRTDFAGDREASRLAINGWVEQATHDKIKDLLHKEDLLSSDPASNTVAVLVNAIYWKGKWEQPFDKAATKPEPFTSGDGSKVTTSLMHIDYQEFQVLERHGVKAIRLPYEGGEVSMVALLPNSSDGLERFEKNLTWPELRRWVLDVKDARAQQTILTLPKLHLDWRRDLIDDLASMGAPTAFSDGADFSGIAKLPYPGGNPLAVGLKISHVIHQTTIDVEEQGTEAAAATAVVMGEVVVSARRVGPPPPPPFIFRADHPFFFVLVDNRTNMILFMGRYVAPRSKANDR
jgi:serpin B